MPFEDQFGQEPADQLPDANEGDPKLIEAVTNHFETLFGPEELVYHEESSSVVHLDLHRFADPEEGIYTFVTSGLAQKPMNVPAEVPDPENFRYAELVVHLPADWPMEWEELSKQENWWPLASLRAIARVPHERESWVWGGHTFRHASDFSPYTEDTKLCAAVICPSYLLPEDSESMKMEDGREVVFLTIAFLYREEFDYCVEHSVEAFLDHVAESGLAPIDFFVVNPNRPNTCPVEAK